MSKKEAELKLKVKTENKEAIGGITKTLLNLSNVVGLAKTAWGAMKGAFNAVIGAWGVQEDAVNSLNQSLVQQGIYTGDLSKKYQDLASALQKKTAYGDEETLSVMAQMQGMMGQTEITEELMTAVMDLAAAKKIDLATAGQQVARTLGTETNALKRMGVEIDMTTSGTERLGAVTSALNSRFGGQAAVAVETTGAFKQFGNAVGDIFEKVGSIMGPTVIKVTKALTEIASGAGEWSIAWKVLETVFASVMALVENVMTRFSAFGNVIGAAASAASSALTGNFKQAWTTLKEGAKESKEMVVAQVAESAEKISAIWSENSDKQEAARLKDLALQKANVDAKLRLQEEEAIRVREARLAQTEQQLADELVSDLLKNDQQIIALDQKIANEENAEARLALLRQKSLVSEELTRNHQRASMTAMQKFEKVIGDEKVKAAQQSLNSIATLQSAKSKELVMLGKAAALANITISTAQGVAKAWSAGPILGPILAPLVAVAGVAQAAKVSGVQLASGGIVKAREGGLNATIGEGGQDEAVIPLGKGGGGMGNNIVINSYGGMLGTPDEAREFAVVIDQELLKLRQNNESQAFDLSVI